MNRQPSGLVEELADLRKQIETAIPLLAPALLFAMNNNRDADAPASPAPLIVECMHVSVIPVSGKDPLIS